MTRVPIPVHVNVTRNERGSAMECVAALDGVRVRGLAVSGEVEMARRLHIRVIQMLTKLDRALC